ncbi:hypothetical protein B0J11DRAFT_455530 [Dendryphion nanum]|uniref:G domain-containing protein n=1 Tax=Dendryphion nanum TaxID=256645 RepID=A0A9P9E8P0_9PLEO|nr:hypothetical protein B0J11DRAFT_455530 [Dendryphion nanum]
MQSTIYKRPALGQRASLGALYDARTDSFLSESIFNTTNVNPAVNVQDLNNATKTFGLDDTYKEKFQKMGVGPELMATILASSFDLGGSGDYLNEPRAQFPSVHRAMHYSLQTVEERLDLFGNNQIQYVDRSQLTRPEPTHILTEIRWGAKCIISATRRIPPHEDHHTASSSLQDAFSNFETSDSSSLIARQFSGQFGTNGARNDTTLDVKLYTDLQPDNSPPIKSLTEAKNHIMRLPSYILHTNGGKGIQIGYTLLPIGFLSIMFGIPPTVSMGQPSPETLTRLVTILDEVGEASRSLNEYYAFLKHNENFVPSDHLIEVGNQIRYVDQGTTELLGKYSRALLIVRRDSGNSQEIWQILDDFNNGEYSAKSLSSLTGTYRDKIEFIIAAVASGAEYLGFNGAHIDDFLQNHTQGLAYVLYFDALSMKQTTNWESNYKLLFELKQKKKCGVAIVDCDATGKQIAGASIAHYDNGSLMTDDFVEEEKEAAKKNRIYYDEKLLQRTDDVPAQRQAVVIACPGTNCDATIQRHWVCFSCQCPVEYGKIDKYFYCACGRIRFDKTAFKCNDPHHGEDVYTFDGVDLYRSLESMQPPNELNVLILGETGVGKSTFINAFINYLTYDTLDDALKTPQLNWVIPCSFAIQLPNRQTNSFTQKKIIVGDDTDEHGGVSGKSATQRATAYAIYVKDQLVRLIDTPGMGDTRGPDQDRQNMSDVLSVLRSYDNIHGIIILLKPNNSRLSFMFRFVIQELLAHLHQSAARNMVYAFTNTRGSNFTPGDSFVPLDNLLNQFQAVLPPLSQSNIYCFDSECFRYLAAKKLEDLDLGEMEDYRRSWVKSATESQRMRSHFKSILPHSVTHTVSLNATRYLIESLIAPMRQVSKTILGSITKSEKQKIDLEKTTATGEALKTKLKIPKSVVEAHESKDGPVTACCHIDCVKAVDESTTRRGSKTSQVSGSDSDLKIRKSLCHNPCSLKEVRAYQPGAAGLEGCAAFYKNAGICLTCRHAVADHEHILVWYSEKTEIHDDPKVLQALQQTNNESQAKAAAVAALDLQIAEFREEHQKIQEAAAKFTVYMQENSITIYNDATLEYLRHLIKEENVKVQLGGSDTRFEALKKECEQYEAYVEAIKDARSRGLPGAVPDEKGVSRLVQELYNMKHYGKDLQKVVSTVSQVYAATFRETAYHVRPKKYWMRAQHSGSSSYGSSQYGNQGLFSSGSVHGNSMGYAGKYSIQSSYNYGQPLPSLLDVGPSTNVRSQPPRRQNSSRKPSSGPGYRQSVLGRSSQQAGTVTEDDASWQAMYAIHAPQQAPPEKSKKQQGYLPFDDEIVTQPNGSSSANGSTSANEKSGLQLDPVHEETPPPYTVVQNGDTAVRGSGNRHSVAGVPKPKRRSSIFGLRGLFKGFLKK